MAAHDEAPPPGYRDVSIPIAELTRPGSVISAALALLALVPFWLLHGFRGWLDISVLTGLAVAVALLVLLVVHELLHALAWMVAGGFRWGQISFGFDRATFTPYTHIATPMTARAYRIGAMTPGLLTGALPTLAAWVFGSGPLSLIGAFMSVGAAGDLIVLWVIRRVPGDTLVIDHATNAGCWVKEDNHRAKNQASRD
jgi:hypothetical protein